MEELRSRDPDLVEKESLLLGDAGRAVFEALTEAGRGLVSKSPTNEAAVLGLTGDVVGPMAKGDAVLVVEDQGSFQVCSMPAIGSP